MKKSTILKIIAFIIVCVSVAYITNYFGNGSIVSVSAEMNNATLPVVYIKYENRLVNLLHGYTNEIDMTLLRDTITPLAKDKEMALWVSGGLSDYDAYSYEVRTLDGSLVENGSIAEMDEEEGYVKCSGTIRMDLKENQEYYYILLLSKGESVVRYYTRIMIAPDARVSELLSFVEEFHDLTFVKEEEDNMIVQKLEPNSTGNNDDLANVSIHSSFDTVTYAGMAPTVISQVIPAIQEINNEYCIFRLSFVMAAGDDTVTNHYNVTEYYKVSYSESKNTALLLDYQRTQNELYSYTNVNTTKNWFKIGVANADEFSYLTSDSEKRVAFVRQGQLWYYDYAKTNIIRIFGFWQEDYLNLNNTYNQHDIQLIGMDDDGNIAFAVSGYMNRGNHEGSTGIAVYRYDAGSNRTEELLFIEIGLPYEQLASYTRKLMYINADGNFFFYLQGTIYRVSREGEVEELAGNVSASELAVAEDFSRIAYPAQEDISANTQVILLDLKTETSTTYEVSNQECIKPIGFVDGDFVCGRAMASDIVQYTDGSILFPMHKLEVLDMNKNVLKEYENSGVYILNAYTEGLNIYFDCAEKNGDDYTVKEPDFITYKEADDSDKISVSYRYSGTSLNLLYMIFPDYIYVKTVPRLLMTKELLRDQSVDVQVERKENVTGYYVYNTCGLTGVYAQAGQALAEAFESRAIVLNRRGVRIWQNTEIPEFYTIDDQIKIVTVETESSSLAACMQMALEYSGVEADITELENYQGNIETLFDEKLGYSGIRLTDVSVDVVLYYLSKGVPVIARLSGDHYVLLTSYNGVALRYIDPLTGVSTREDRTTLSNQLAQAGGVYITYVPE